MRSHVGVIISVLAALFATGCADDEVSASDESAILGGKEDERTTKAVGALVDVFHMSNGPGYQAFCTATLIAPRVVLTAKHCTMQVRGSYGFAMGATANTDFSTGAGPERVVLAERAEEASLGGSGALGLGSDVALVYLTEPITSVQPLPLGDLADTDVGKTFSATGYGVRDDGGSGQRRSGSIVLKALRGKVLPPLVTFEEFDRRSGGLTTANREDYDGMTLIDGYEVVTGPNRTKAQPCSGDSGGPLLGKRNNKLHVFGVASYVLSTPREPCAFGTVYATFGPTTRPMIDQALR